MSNKASKQRRNEPREQAAPASAATSGPQWWWYALGLLVPLILLFEVYQPAIRAPFLFDDRYLPFLVPAFAQQPLSSWVGVVRPLLMIGYWFNYQSSQLEPYSYHLVNILFHYANAVFVWLAMRKLLEWAGVESALRTLLALFGGALFLFHPIQTESVSYVASRSENQSLFFFLAAFVVFLYRRARAVPVLETVFILLLFGCAVLTKEHTAALPAILLLTDYYFNRGFDISGIRRNWKLYIPIALGGALAAIFVLRVLATSKSAGFAMQDLPWYQYFFTQCRALWVYLRMFVLPYDLNLDHDFPFSRTILDHGAIVGLIALLAVTAAAWIWRREYKLASYGWFAFLLLMAPTSSVIPIRDPLVDRRVYLAFLPLLLIASEAFLRLRLSRTALAAILGVIVTVSAFASYSRNAVWGNSIALWKDTVEKSPNKSRPHFQLAFAYYTDGRCAEAMKEYERVSHLDKPDYSLYADWGLAAECANQPQIALEKFHQAAALDKTAHIYSLIGMVHAKQNEREQAFAALDEAQKIDPGFYVIYIYRGNLLILSQEFDKAAEQFEKALSINPSDQNARNGLDLARRRVAPQVR